MHKARKPMIFNLLAGAVLAAVSGVSQPAFAWPEKPITMIIPFSAGGGTDATGRMLAALMEKELGTPVNVVNRPGGNGLVGHSAIAAAAPDGYTIGVATTESMSYKPTGLSQFRPTTDFSAIAVYNTDATSVVVTPDSKYKSLAELLEAIKSGEHVRVSTGGAFGGSYQIAFGLLLKDRGVDPMKPTYVSSQGSAPGLQEMVAGGVDVTVTTLAEAASLIQAGKVRPLAVIGDKRNPGYPDVPSTAEAVGATELTFSSWRGVMAPAGLPQEVADRLRAVVKQGAASKEFKEFMGNRGFGVAWIEGEDLKSFLVTSEDEMATGLKEIGLAK